MGSISLVKRGEQSSLDREQSLALTSNKCGSPRTAASSGHGGHGGGDGETVGWFKTFCNIFVSFVGACRHLLLLPAPPQHVRAVDERGGTHAGAGVLGLPYAFRKSGLVLGAGFLILTAALSLHCMLMLVRCKKHLVRARCRVPSALQLCVRGASHAKPALAASFNVHWRGGTQEHKNVNSYSQVAAWAFGPAAGIATNALLTVSQVRRISPDPPGCSHGRRRSDTDDHVGLIGRQVGFCVGYLVFIGQNSKSIDGLPKWEHILACFPLLSGLALVRVFLPTLPAGLECPPSSGATTHSGWRACVRACVRAC